MARVYGSPFKIDWFNKDAVIAYAKKFGPGQVVVKYPGRANYNITDANSANLEYDGVEIIYRT